MQNEKAIREEIVRIATRCYDRGLLVAGDGNISVRVGPNRLIATPSAVSKGWMTPDMMVVVDLEGQPLEPSSYKVSSEWPMHRVIYEARPDIHAVVHAHPPHATAFAVAGLSLEKAILSEVVLTLGCVPLAAYGTPSTRELTDAIEPFLQYHDALLMANHARTVTSKPAHASARGSCESPLPTHSTRLKPFAWMASTSAPSLTNMSTNPATP